MLRLKILDFRHFHKHIVFVEDGEKNLIKEIRNYINVSVVIDLECGNTSEGK